MRRLFEIVLVVVCLIGLAGHSAAQEPPPGWPIEQRCVAWSRAPEGWTYPGVILLRGWAGLHGVSHDWATPRVLAFIDDEFRVLPGSLSPDGHWYAYPKVDHWEDTSVGTWMISKFWISEIRIYDTSASNGPFFMPWDEELETHTSELLPILRWQDDDHFVYRGDGSLRLVNPVENEIVPWQHGIGYTFLSIDFYPSPDQTRGVLVGLGETELVMYDVGTGEEISRHYLPHPAQRVHEVSWFPQSDRFLLRTSIYDPWDNGIATETEQSLLYDADGEMIEVVAHNVMEGDHAVSFQEIRWSSDGRYAAIPMDRTRDGEYNWTLHLADMEQRRIVDTCLTVLWPGAWSPTGPQLALRAPGDKVQVFDVDTWQLYTVALHDGAIIGWRE